jgi:16S rRNA (adenine1518-N6/adenine1519-N6)-dimethyltransferase
MMARRSKSRSLSSPRVVSEILRSEGIRPRRSMGQNFLVDANVLDIIEEAAGLERTDTAIEVGAGVGALTQVLAENCDRVLAFEPDRRLARVLRGELGGLEGLTIIEEDALDFDLEALFDGVPPTASLVSNLPYRIAATLIIKWLAGYPWISDYTVMVQREVADRICAEPGGRDYSAATVKVRCRAKVRRVAKVSRNSFLPSPAVDSAIVRLDRLEGGPLASIDGGLFDYVVSACFSQRRKKIINALTTGRGRFTPEGAEAALKELGIDAGSRAEDVPPQRYAKLAASLQGSLPGDQAEPAGSYRER